MAGVHLTDRLGRPHSRTTWAHSAGNAQLVDERHRTWVGRGPETAPIAIALTVLAASGRDQAHRIRAQQVSCRLSCCPAAARRA
jgi:hypothetical protein